MMTEKPIHQPALVYKTNENRSVFETDPEPVPFTDEQMDIIAAALAQSSIALRNEMQAAIDKAVTELRAEKNLHEAVAELRGQMTAVLALLANSRSENND